MQQTQNALKFHHIHLNVNDIEQTQKLFEQVLSAGVVKRFTVGTKEIVHMDFGGTSILLSSVNEERPPGINHLGISTTEVDKSLAEFIQQGWRLVDVQKNGDLRNVFVESPEGLLIELMETN